LEDSYIIELQSEYNVIRPKYKLIFEGNKHIGIILRSMNLIVSILEYIWGLHMKRLSYNNEDKYYTHSAKTKLYSVCRLNAEKGKSSIIRTITNLALCCDCHEITIRQAIKFNGVVNNT
jgi:hypothetical protein